ncbi:MAG: KH domain-containing protein [Desulfocapsaceae bacterium]|nr:KH domain-containing protein [Desulfocapsaceae bacterium]
MKELVAYIAKSLVDHPDDVKTVQAEEDDSIVVELTVAQDDLGKVIGKQGRTARAIRSLLAAAVGRENKRSRLEILE